MTDSRTLDAGSACLPNVVIIGAMKAGTSALHAYLARHPQVAMSTPKELNFFFGRETGDTSGEWSPRGNWHRGVHWYAGHFDSTAAVRGEASPGYTSPDHPEVPERMGAVLPDARLVYLVRDPVARAVSQYRHHRRERAEQRPIAEALLDPAGQYVSRSRYAERLAPFLEHYAHTQLTVVVSERLRAAPRQTLSSLFATLGIDDGFWDPAMARPEHVSAGDTPLLGSRLLGALAEQIADDTQRLRELAGDDLPEWTL